MDVQPWGAGVPPSSPEDNLASGKTGPLLPGPPTVNPPSELPKLGLQEGLGAVGSAPQRHRFRQSHPMACLRASFGPDLSLQFR